MARATTVVLLGLAISLPFGAPALARDATSQEALAALNHQRQAAGIPGSISADGNWHAACEAHNRWGKLNNRLQHSEPADSPGYSAEGHWAATVSVLSGGVSWLTRNPWEYAPIHLHQLLHPRLDKMGIAETDGFGCATTLAGRARAPLSAPRTYTYPGPNQVHRPSEVAYESPYTPGEKVGIPAGARTGPYLYLMFDGPWSVWASAKLDSATLVGPSGPVAIRTVDNSTPGVGHYLPTGAEIIPVDPLAPQSSYTASVTASVTEYGGATTKVEHSWTFRTSASERSRTRGADGGAIAEEQRPAPRDRVRHLPPAPDWGRIANRPDHLLVVVDAHRVGISRLILQGRRKGQRRWRQLDSRSKAIGKVRMKARIGAGIWYLRLVEEYIDYEHELIDQGLFDEFDPLYSTTKGTG